MSVTHGVLTMEVQHCITCIMSLPVVVALQSRFAEAVTESRELRREGDASAPEVLALRASALYGSGNLDLAMRCYSEVGRQPLPRWWAVMGQSIYSIHPFPTTLESTWTWPCAATWRLGVSPSWLVVNDRAPRRVHAVWW